MNWKAALATIRAEYAKHGKTTQKAMRTYAEGRISYGVFMEARRAGMRMYQEEHEQ